MQYKNEVIIMNFTTPYAINIGGYLVREDHLGKAPCLNVNADRGLFFPDLDQWLPCLSSNSIEEFLRYLAESPLEGLSLTLEHTETFA